MPIFNRMLEVLRVLDKANLLEDSTVYSYGSAYFKPHPTTSKIRIYKDLTYGAYDNIDTSRFPNDITVVFGNEARKIWSNRAVMTSVKTKIESLGFAVETKNAMTICLTQKVRSEHASNERILVEADAASTCC